MPSINGPANADERPFPGDPDFAAAVEAWATKQGVDPDHATLHQMLAQLPEPPAGEAALQLLLKVLPL